METPNLHASNAYCVTPKSVSLMQGLKHQTTEEQDEVADGMVVEASAAEICLELLPHGPPQVIHNRES